MSDLWYYFCITLMFIGLFFILTAAVGILRFKDLYTRLHAASKGTTFGFCFLIIGASMLYGTERDISKAVVAVLFQFLTAPIGAHMIARVGLKKGLRPIKSPSGELMDESHEGVKKLESQQS